MFDYYELKFVFHGADCKRRAADMDEARAAKKELQAAGVKEITIFGVKKGTKEIQAAKKAYVKPEFKHEPATKAAKTPKVKKAPATKKKAAKRKKTAVKMTGTTGTYTTDYNNEKKAKAAAKNIRALGFDTEIIEPRGQLDLFKTIKNFKIEFSKDEIDILRGALHLGGWSNIQNYLNSDEYVKLLNTLFDAGRLQRPKIELKNNEICALCLSLEKRIKNEPNVFLKERHEKLRKQLESFVI